MRLSFVYMKTFFKRALPGGLHKCLSMALGELLSAHVLHYRNSARTLFGPFPKAAATTTKNPRSLCIPLQRRAQMLQKAPYTNREPKMKPLVKTNFNFEVG